MDGSDRHGGERHSPAMPVPGNGSSLRLKSDQGRVLASKLRLTLLALGCSTNKEFCARFAAINPATAFVTQSAYKWMSGKAMPRVSSVYEDWAQVLEGRLTASFIASSSFDEFAAALCQFRPVPKNALAALRQEAGLPSASLPGLAPSPPAQGALRLAEQLLIGTYLALSPAWSRAEANKLILGVARIAAGPSQGLHVTYSERLFSSNVDMSGELRCDGRTAQCALTCSYTRRLFFLALDVPPPPANLVGGILSGSAIHDHEARPVASPILLVRVRDDEKALDALAGYIAAEDDIVAEALGTLGYRADTTTSVAAQMITFLTAAPNKGRLEISPTILGRLGLAMDRLASPSGTFAEAPTYRTVPAQKRK